MEDKNFFLCSGLTSNEGSVISRVMSNIGRDSSARAIFLFHLHVGTRLALRIFIPAVTIFFAFYFVLGPGLFISFMATILDGGFLLSGIFTTFHCIIFAGLAGRRICLGLTGWIRHLPTEGTIQRRMAGIAVFIAQIPILAVIAGLAYVASQSSMVSALPYLVGLPLAGLSCSFCILPVKKRLLIRPLAVLSGICLASNNWGILAGGLVVLIVTDLASGPLVIKKKRVRFLKPLKGWLILGTINWRALKLRPFVVYLVSVPFIGATQLFIANNNPSPLLAERVIRFGGALSMIIFCSIFANMLASRRPPWPWVRSLPWSAKPRIISDSLFVGLHVLPLLVLVGVMNIKSMLPLFISLPLFTLFSAYSIRQARESSMGASGKVLLFGTIGALFLCLIPWGSLLFLALTPFVSKAAIKADKYQKVSQWLELHHLAAGDSLSWSK